MCIPQSQDKGCECCSEQGESSIPPSFLKPPKNKCILPAQGCLYPLGPGHALSRFYNDNANLTVSACELYYRIYILVTYYFSVHILIFIILIPQKYGNGEWTFDSVSSSNLFDATFPVATN